MSNQGQGLLSHYYLGFVWRVLIREGVNGVPLKSVIIKILAKKSVKFKGKNR